MTEMCFGPTPSSASLLSPPLSTSWREREGGGKGKGEREGGKEGGEKKGERERERGREGECTETSTFG